MATTRTVCDHRSFSHGVPASGVLSKDCADNGTRTPADWRDRPPVRTERTN